MEELLRWHGPCGIYCKACPGIRFYNCKGCREEKGKISKFPTCKTYECVINKGYDFCSECEEFPCEMLMPIVNFEIFLPHNSKVYNSVMIKKLGLKEWSKICEERTNYYYKGKKIRYGGDPLTLEKKDASLYKKKEKK